MYTVASRITNKDMLEFLKAMLNLKLVSLIIKTAIIYTNFQNTTAMENLNK
jgi:hypothetical protein